MKSIRFKFFAFISLLLLALCLIINTVPLQASRDAVFEEKKNALTSQGSATAGALSRLEKLSAEDIAEILKLLEMNGYSRVLVSDTEGRTIYDSTPAEAAPEDIQSALGGDTVFRSRFESGAFDSSYTTPMSANGSITGALHIRELDTERAEILIGLQNRILAVSVSISIAALALAVIFSSVLLRRLSELVDSMRVVGKGDYSHRLKLSGQDEITELGNEFNNLTEKLETTEQQRRRFVSDASHELKTPLASIRLLSDSIVQSESMDESTMREFVADINTEAERLQHTTENLLSLSRLDDDVHVEEVPVDLKQTALDALKTLQPLAAEKDVHIRCFLDDGCVIMSSNDDAYHIVFNLMENAVKYNVRGGSVEVTASCGEDTVKFCVKDTGIGIPEEDRLNIFTRFYRVDKARSRESGGSGLGLSIVHDAAKVHGGKVTVGANKPQGSVFTVEFPRPTSEQTGI